jgi:hypothetical protein
MPRVSGSAVGADTCKYPETASDRSRGKADPATGPRARAKDRTVWVRRSAIRPVPPYSKVPAHALESVRQSLGDDDDEAREQLDAGFERFERSQPLLAAYVASALGRPLDETALALGYFLALAVWMAFEHAHGEHIDEVGEAELSATEELLNLDEELRRSDPAETLDSDDVVAMQQPYLLEFVHEHIEVTLETHAEDVDVDDVHTVYRVVLIEILALSYAVRRPAGYPLAKTELLA